MAIHIGREIESKFQESGLKHSEFAKRINTGTRNVYSIFSRKDISVEQLKKISAVLNFNFFSLYEEALPPTLHEAPAQYIAEKKRERVSVIVELDGLQTTLDKVVKRLTAFNQAI